MREIVTQHDKEFGDMLSALGFEDVVKFKFEAATNAIPTITIERYASKGDIKILTEFFSLRKPHKNPQLKDWAERKVSGNRNR